MRTVTLIDGRQVDSRSEDWRHECEARYVADLPDRAARQTYLQKVIDKRGADAGQRLQSLATTIFTAKRTGGAT